MEARSAPRAILTNADERTAWTTSRQRSRPAVPAGRQPVGVVRARRRHVSPVEQGANRRTGPSPIARAERKHRTRHHDGLIKYLGSKRRLVPVLAALAQVTGARRALDLFTGTTRVAQAWRRAGLSVVAADLGRPPHVFARAYVAAALDGPQRRALEHELRRLDALPGVAGYVTEVFCRRARYFTPANGERIDAIRAAIAADHAGTWLEPLVLTALIEAADRVDSTTGV